MSVRADQVVHLVLPSPLRWAATNPVIAAAARAVARLRKRARQPHVPPMSEEWLQRHAADRTYYSND